MRVHPGTVVAPCAAICACLSSCHPAVKISTGSQALDELLGGGVETKAVRQAAAACACPGKLPAHTLGGCEST